jgi:hypothetical protein
MLYESVNFQGGGGLGAPDWSAQVETLVWMMMQASLKDAYAPFF